MKIPGIRLAPAWRGAGAKRIPGESCAQRYQHSGRRMEKSRIFSQGIGDVLYNQIIGLKRAERVFVLCSFNRVGPRRCPMSAGGVVAAEPEVRSGREEISEG